MSQYSGFERKIAFVLTQFPGLKLAIKKVYQRLNYMRYKKDFSFKSDYNLTKITYDDKESFFGYYDKSPMNSSNEYIIFQSSNVDTKKLSRLLSLPAGAEATGLQVVENENGHAYIMSNAQHLGDFTKTTPSELKEELAPKIDKFNAPFGYIGGMPGIK